jgi:hypothetical protein
VVVEETGRGLLPGPFLPTVLASSVVARLAASPVHDELLARFAAGATGTCATTAEGLTAERATADAGWLVTGTTVPVIGALTAQAAVLGAHVHDASHGGGVSSTRTIWFTVAGDQLERLERDRLCGVDLTRDIGAFRLGSVAVSDDHVLGGDEDGVRSIAALLFAAEAAGLARWCQETGLAYAKG